MNLDDKLRIMILKEFGFNKAIKENTISDEDLDLIKESTNDGFIQDEITSILNERIHEKIVVSLANYKKFRQLNGFAAASARSQYKWELQTFLNSANYVNDTDKKIIELELKK